MKTMWVDSEVDAMVEFKSGLALPILKSIRWSGRRIDFSTRPRVERTTATLLYRFEEGSTRYALRFEPGRQKWFLEGIDDSGMLEDRSEFPPPRVFPPTNWRR